jgi:hypothetical protein
VLPDIDKTTVVRNTNIHHSSNHVTTSPDENGDSGRNSSEVRVGPELDKDGFEVALWKDRQLRKGAVFGHKEKGVLGPESLARRFKMHGLSLEEID